MDGYTQSLILLTVYRAVRQLDDALALTLYIAAKGDYMEKARLLALLMNILPIPSRCSPFFICAMTSI